MAEVLPFRGVRFNPEIVINIASVLCPPYDLITPKNQKLYEQKSPYNIVRLEKPEENGYQAAASTFKDWLKNGILIFDEKGAFYLHQHTFNFQGRKYNRLGLMAIVKADQEQILPHENTLPHPIADRLQLLRFCQANFSPIFALYSDQENKITTLLSSYTSNKPILEIDNHESHKLWRIDEEDIIACLSRLFLPQKIYIADGHHRFQASLLYQKENPAARYTLMNLIEANSSGLFILPVHRLLSGITKDAWNKFKQDISLLFEMKAFSSLGELRQALNENSIGAYFNREAYLLTPQGRAADFPSTLHLLHELLIPHLFYHSLSYVTEFDLQSGLNLTVDNLLFLVSPLTATKVIELARAEITLPGKATYFYPKPPTGLVFYKI